jgi:hypothetical protein
VPLTPFMARQEKKKNTHNAQPTEIADVKIQERLA